MLQVARGRSSPSLQRTSRSIRPKGTPILGRVQAKSEKKIGDVDQSAKDRDPIPRGRGGVRLLACADRPALRVYRTVRARAEPVGRAARRSIMAQFAGEPIAEADVVILRLVELVRCHLNARQDGPHLVRAAARLQHRARRGYEDGRAPRSVNHPSQRAHSVFLPETSVVRFVNLIGHRWAGSQ